MFAGNPEGDQGTAGTDPGLLITKKILKIDRGFGARLKPFKTTSEQV